MDQASAKRAQEKLDGTHATRDHGFVESAVIRPGSDAVHLEPCNPCHVKSRASLSALVDDGLHKLVWPRVATGTSPVDPQDASLLDWWHPPGRQFRLCQARHCTRAWPKQTAGIQQATPGGTGRAQWPHWHTFKPLQGQASLCTSGHLTIHCTPPSNCIVASHLQFVARHQTLSVKLPLEKWFE